MIVTSTQFVYPVATAIDDLDDLNEDDADEDDGVTVIKTITLTLSKEPALITTVIDGQLLEVTTNP